MSTKMKKVVLTCDFTILVPEYVDPQQLHLSIPVYEAIGVGYDSDNIDGIEIPFGLVDDAEIIEHETTQIEEVLEDTSTSENEPESHAIIEPEVIDWRKYLHLDVRISSDSPIVNGTSLTVGKIVTLIVDGWSWIDILRTYPELREDGIRACLAYTVETDAEMSPLKDPQPIPSPEPPQQVLHPPAPVPGTRVKFGEMPAGMFFSDGHRTFVKLQTVLPSGYRQICGRFCFPAEAESPTLIGDFGNYFNSVDNNGSPCQCPDWVEFRVIAKPTVTP